MSGWSVRTRLTAEAVLRQDRAMSASADTDPNLPLLEERGPGRGRNSRLYQSFRKQKRVNQLWHRFAVVHVPIAVGLIVLSVVLWNWLQRERAEPDQVVEREVQVEVPVPVEVPIPGPTVTELAVEAAATRIGVGGGVGGSYTTQPGDTLSAIARRELGSAQRAGELAAFNGIADPDVLPVGVELRLPD